MRRSWRQTIRIVKFTWIENVVQMKSLRKYLVHIHGRGKSTRKNFGPLGRRNARAKQKQVDISIRKTETKVKTCNFKKVALDWSAEEPALSKDYEKLTKKDGNTLNESPKKRRSKWRRRRPRKIWSTVVVGNITRLFWIHRATVVVKRRGKRILLRRRSWRQFGARVQSEQTRNIGSQVETLTESRTRASGQIYVAREWNDA